MSKKMSLTAQVASLSTNFWYANVMEMMERLAFYGVRAIAPLYLVASAQNNGLGLDYAEKGIIYSVWAAIQCFVPMVSGGYTDRYGYRKSLAVAFAINFTGFIAMAQSRPIADYLSAQGWDGAGFWVFMVAACMIGLGTAIFKPPIAATVARSTTEETSSMGWGIFYWVVNIGGGLAPMGAAVLRAEIDWELVFYAAAMVTACNFIPLIFLYREPPKVEAVDPTEKPKNPVEVFVHSVATIVRDVRLMVFLGIFACFFLMFMQLWDLLPNFIDEWVDTSDVAGYFGWFSDGWVSQNGQTKPEMIINLDSLAIIALVIPVSWLVGRVSKVAAMIIGMVIALVGFMGAGLTSVGLFCCAMVVVFAIGEMTCSPTFNAYVGLIAPKDKKALYMGYSNLPFAIGWAVGGALGGFVYAQCGDRANLALKHMATETELLVKATQVVDWSDSLEKLPDILVIPRDGAFELLERDFGMDAATLREEFKHDAGQIENLALQYIALHSEYRERAAAGLAEAIRDTNPSLTMMAIADELDEGDDAMACIRPFLGRFVHLLPDALNCRRGTGLALARELASGKGGDLPGGESAAVVSMLWERFGDDPDVLDNLALEYLAQATDRVRTKVGMVTLDASDASERMAEVTKLFWYRAGEVVRGAGGSHGRERTGDLDESIRSLDLPSGLLPDEALYVYLMNHPQHRYAVVSRKEWREDLGLLRELIRSDPKILAIVVSGNENEGWTDRLLNGFRRLVGSGGETGEMTEEGVDYRKLAGSNDLLQKALAAKDWSKCPAYAAQVVGMNPFEARALAATDEGRARKVLWDAYKPYTVWYYLGAVGLLGTLGMVVFYFATRSVVAKVGRGD